MSACQIEDTYGLTKDHIDALETFEKQFPIKNKKFSKGEKSEMKNELKTAIETVVRNAWKSYSLFDVMNPRQNFQSTGIGNVERFLKTVKHLANMIVSVLFQSKQKVNEVQLPSSESNFLSSYANYFMFLYMI